MKLKCPCCHAEFAIEAAFNGDSARSAFGVVLKLLGPIGSTLGQYLGMFRPAGRGLGWDRTERLISELLPMIDAQQVTRDGITRVATREMWQRGFVAMIERRDAGKLTLPLKSHGYLVEIVAGLAEKSAAAAESARETQLRAGHRSGAATALRDGVLQEISRIEGSVLLGHIGREEANEQIRRLRSGQEVKDG